MRWDAKLTACKSAFTVEYDIPVQKKIGVFIIKVLTFGYTIDREKVLIYNLFKLKLF